MNDTRAGRFLSIVAAVFLVGFSFFILKELQSILIPFFVAVILSFLFQPFNEWLKRKKIPGWLSIIIVVIVIFIISNFFSVFIWTSINTFKAEIPKYSEKMQILAQDFISYLKSVGVSDEIIKDNFDPAKFFTGDVISSLLSTLITGVASLFTHYVLILIYIIFLLTEFGSIKIRILRAFSRERSRKITETLTDIFSDVRKYIVGKTLINFAHGLFITILFWAFGLDFAIIWGFLTFLLAYIPNIGAFIATILPFLTALIEYDNLITPFVLLIIMAVSGSIFGNILEPKILGDRLNLSPILLLFSLIFWGYIWGIVGMILAVPVMSMIKITLSKFESTKPISILMSYDVPVKKSNNDSQQEINFKD